MRILVLNLKIYYLHLTAIYLQSYTILLKYFAYKLFSGQQNWLQVQPRIMKCPKLFGRNNSAVFVLRYIYNLITGTDMNFNKVIIPHYSYCYLKNYYNFFINLFY